MAPLACSTCGRSAWQQAPCHKIESFAWSVCLQVWFHHNLVPELCLSISHITSVLGTARRQSMASSLPFSHTASQIEIKSQHCPWVSWLYNSSQSSKMRRRFLQRTGVFWNYPGLFYLEWEKPQKKTTVRAENLNGFSGIRVILVATLSVSYDFFLSHWSEFVQFTIKWMTNFLRIQIRT
jgi:hypothetical protein